MAIVRHPFLWIGFAVLWMVLQDRYNPGYFVAGLVNGAILLLLFPTPEIRLIRLKIGGFAGFFPWLIKAVRMTGYFIWELLKSNWAVALLVLSPKPNLKPGILAMDLKIRQPGQIATLANMITLTPGTTTVDVAKDYSVLYFHTIDCSDPESVLAVARRFEAMIMEVME